MTFTLLEFVALLALTAAVGYSSGWFSGRRSLVQKLVGLLLERGSGAVVRHLAVLRNDLAAQKGPQGTPPYRQGFSE